MKSKLCFFGIFLLLVSYSAVSHAQETNKLSKKEKQGGWELLFNGKDFSGWRQYNGTEMPKNWEIEEGAMKVLPADPSKLGHGGGGDIIFAGKIFTDFELSLDWKAGDQANSGIFYYVHELPGKPIYYAAPEIQVLDNENAGDNKVESHLAGSLYDMIAADPSSVHPAGEWNNIVISVKAGKVTHMQNGQKVVEYTLWTKEWNDLVQNSKFRSFPGFTDGIAHNGYIGLQDHGYTVWFRNVKIREL
jgi:hypothetical protein